MGFGLISVSLFGHGVGDVVLLFHFFGDWCVEGMWGGGLRGIRGIGVIVIVIGYWEIMGGYVFRCDLNGVGVNGRTV